MRAVPPGACRLAALALLCASSGCAGPARGRAPDRAPRTTAPAAHAPSIFDTDWMWSDEGDANVRLSRWRGVPLVVSFVYTSCTTVCPTTLERLRQVNERYRRAGRAAEFLLVTLDPWTDSAEELRAFKRSRDLPPAWHLLRASFPQTRALADVLRVRLIDDGTHVIHDGTIALVDPDGRLAGHL